MFSSTTCLFYGQYVYEICNFTSFSGCSGNPATVRYLNTDHATCTEMSGCLLIGSCPARCTLINNQNQWCKVYYPSVLAFFDSFTQWSQ